MYDNYKLARDSLASAATTPLQRAWLERLGSVDPWPEPPSPAFAVVVVNHQTARRTQGSSMEITTRPVWNLGGITADSSQIQRAT